MLFDEVAAAAALCAVRVRLTLVLRNELGGRNIVYQLLGILAYPAGTALGANPRAVRLFPA